MKVNFDGMLPGDHDGQENDYHIITNAIKAIPANKDGLTCEIGLRKGGTSSYIMDALSKRDGVKVHVAVDPYGDIIYAEKEGSDLRLNYTNEMRDKYIGTVYLYAMEKGVNFVFMNMDDEEFFKRYPDGVSFYQEEKYTLGEYIFAHLDGPHQYEPVLNEFLWFNDRMTSGATMVFDDVESYDHIKLEEDHILPRGWKILEKHGRKASYQKL
jgi:hypothetical protein